MNPTLRKFLYRAAILALIFLGFRYIFPLILPFLLGLLLALAAEPMVRFGCRQLRLPRPVASGIGVSMAFLFLATALVLLAALVLRELSRLTGVLPDLEGTVRSGMQAVSSWLLRLAEKAPGSIAPVLQRSINESFSGGAALLDKITAWLLHLASGLLSRVPGRALTLVTGIISSFMISAKLPRLKAWVRSRLSTDRLQAAGKTLLRLKRTLGSWLKAQLKLSGITFTVATCGLFLLRIPHAPVWGAVVALVDAFPILGTGTVLVPWSLVSFLQGDRLAAFGLLGLYAAASVTRAVLEPRLVGRQLGLDPLVTLMALYAGFRLFGIFGMILSPMIAVTVTQLLEPERDG